jgi:hypothetical protein
VDELVEQFVAYFAHWSEEAQPKIFRGHVAEKIGIEGSIFRLGRRIRTDVSSRRIKCGSLNAISSQVRQPMMPAAARLGWSILHRLLSAISLRRSAACPLGSFATELHRAQHVRSSPNR